MSMTMQRVDDRHHQSLPLFYPDYKPGSLKSRSSKDVQFYEGSPRSSRSPSTQRGNHKSSRQHWESNPSRPSETSLKSCLRKPSEKHAVNKENFKDSDNDTKGGHFKEIENNRKVGGFRDNDDDRSFTATENRNKFPIKKWRAKKVEQKDSVDDCKENSENVKMKGFSYPRFRYPLRFHYGSGTQSKSVTISAIPAGFRTSSFYSSLPRRQRQVEPGSLSTGKNRRGKNEKQKHGTKPEKKTVMGNDRNSRTPSPERELNGVYHVVHETETIQVLEETEVEEKQKSKTTDEDNTWTTTDQSDDDDDKALEVKDKVTDGSKRRSPRSSHSNRSEESIKEAGSSSSDEARLKIEDDSSDDEDQRRSKKKEKRKNMKTKKNGDKDKTETKKYAADFDENSSEVLSVD